MSHESFDQKVKKVTAVKKLRSLVLIGYHDPHLFKYSWSMIHTVCFFDDNLDIFEKT
jgi:hypothetical protein